MMHDDRRRGSRSEVLPMANIDPPGAVLGAVRYQSEKNGAFRVSSG